MSTQIGITHAEHTVVRPVEGGSMTEAVGGVAAVVLGILGLIGVIPQILAAIAVIVVGITLLSAGGALAARFSRVLADEPQPVRTRVASGMGMEVLASIAGIVLGILALFGVTSPSLLAVSAIVLGGALLMTSNAMMRLTALLQARSSAGMAGAETSVGMPAVAGPDVFMGIGAVVLGILALGGHAPDVLSLIAMIAIGAAVLLSDSPMAERFFSLFG